jgi:tetrahydromethanopterin S-methyltransferase subunit F
LAEELQYTQQLIEKHRGLKHGLQH